MIHVGVGQIVWIIVLFLQFLTIVESVYFAEEYRAWKSRQECRTIHEDLSIEGGEHFEKRGFDRADVLILDRVAPSVVRLERSTLVAIGEIGWPIVVMILWLMELTKLDKGLPFPYEYLGVLEIIAAFPYLKMMIGAMQDGYKAENRLWGVLVVSTIWLIATSFNAYFGWTVELRMKLPFLIMYGLFQVCNIGVRLVGSSWHLLQVKEMQSPNYDNIWDENDGRWHLKSDKEEWVHLIMDSVLMLFWFVDCNDYGRKSSAAVDIVASASYFLVVRGYDVWFELLCDEVLLCRKSEALSRELESYDV